MDGRQQLKLPGECADSPDGSLAASSRCSLTAGCCGNIWARGWCSLGSQEALISDSHQGMEVVITEKTHINQPRFLKEDESHMAVLLSRAAD